VLFPGLSHSCVHNFDRRLVTSQEGLGFNTLPVRMKDVASIG